jgi:glycosyltransferase involved in cell wall biosynthesis
MHGAFLNFLYVAVERLLVPITDRLIFESPYSMDEFAKRVTDASNKAVLNVNGIPEVTPDLSPWPRSLGSSADPLRLAAFGLLRPIKGFDTLIDALSELRKSGVLFSAAIFGEGSERASLEAKVRDLGLSHCVRLPGETADTLYEMRLAHIVVQPSQFESFGLVTLEAQALGRAVIASGVGGLKHLVADGATGILVEPDSPTQIKEAIRRILNNPDATLEMRKSAADQAREYYSETAMVNGALSIYESLCPKEPR